MRSFEVEIKPSDIIFLYGQKAITECANIRCRAKLEFPDISRLDATFGDEEEREAAHQKLLNFKKLLDSDTLTDLDQLDTPQNNEDTQKLTEKSLPAELTADKVRALEATLRKKGKTEWIGTTEEGRTIRLTVEPDNGTADINMTFAELYAVRAAMEAFQVKELEIVYKPNTSSWKGNA